MSVYKTMKYSTIFGMVLFVFTIATVIFLEIAGLQRYSSFFIQDILIPIWFLFFIISFYLNRCPQCETFQWGSVLGIRKKCWHCDCDLTIDHEESK